MTLPRNRVIWRGRVEQLFDPLVLGLKHGDRVELHKVDGEPCPRCGRPMYDYEVEPGVTVPACDCGP